MGQVSTQEDQNERRSEAEFIRHSRLDQFNVRGLPDTLPAPIKPDQVAALAKLEDAFKALADFDKRIASAKPKNLTKLVDLAVANSVERPRLERNCRIAMIGLAKTIEPAKLRRELLDMFR